MPPGNPEALAEKIQALHDDVGMRERLGKAGMARVQRQFSYQAMGIQYRELMDVVETGNPDAIPAPEKFSEETETTSTVSPDDKKKSTIVLIDMDNTVVDWDAQFIDVFSTQLSMDKEALTKKVCRREPNPNRSRSRSRNRNRNSNPQP